MIKRRIEEPVEEGQDGDAAATGYKRISVIRHIIFSVIIYAYVVRLCENLVHPRARS